VPDARVLPPESLRFFYLDDNWRRALFDGAVSIGRASSRDTFFHELLQDVLFRAANEAAKLLRSRRIGVDPPAAEVAADRISGFLFRSAVVSAWPNLAVRGGMNDGSSLKILRLDALAPDVLLCLFRGIPDFVELAEPQEGFRFGVDDDGKLPLRQPVSDGAQPIGTQLEPPLAVVPACLRSGSAGVLDVGALVAAVSKALTTAGAGLATFGPADLALQMIKSPETIRFTAQPGDP